MAYDPFWLRDDIHNSQAERPREVGHGLPTCSRIGVESRQMAVLEDWTESVRLTWEHTRELAEVVCQSKVQRIENIPDQLGRLVSLDQSYSGKQFFALDQRGTLWACGKNFPDSAPLGDGSATERKAPVSVGGGFAEISLGRSHRVARKQDGSVWFWGAHHTSFGSPSWATVSPGWLAKGSGRFCGCCCSTPGPQGGCSLGLRASTSRGQAGVSARTAASSGRFDWVALSRRSHGNTQAWR